MASNKMNIAVIPGDGIGTEVIPEGLRVLNAAANKYGLELSFDQFNFSSSNYYQQHGQMMPDNWKDQISKHDAIFFGAVGWPDTVPDHVSLWGSLWVPGRLLGVPGRSLGGSWLDSWIWPPLGTYHFEYPSRIISVISQPRRHQG